MIIKYPLTTEKAVRLVESENKLFFIIDNNANRLSIRDEVEKLFKVKVDRVNIINNSKGCKKAIITLNKKFNAVDVATDMGLM